jgi:hypothetical protein
MRPIAKIFAKVSLNSPRIRTTRGTGFSSLPDYGAIRTKGGATAGDKGSVMFFLLRVAFWLSIVLILLPSGETSKHTPGAVEAVSAAGAAVSDLGQFCARQPDACEVGGKAAVALGERAQAGAKMVYDFLNDKRDDRRATGSVTQAASKTSQHTLTPSDLKPQWHGPVPLPRERPAAADHQRHRVAAR